MDRQLVGMGSCKDQPAQTVENQTDKNDSKKEANFEEAIAASGYGKFHYLLYLSIIPASWASGMDTSNTSMIAPSAECDLNLTLFQKGVLYALVYVGMVSSALMWGFIGDAFGRKPIVYYGYLIDGILNVLSGLSQNFYSLAFFKVACGLIVSGPYASSMAYCAEFHCMKDRERITMVIGTFITVGVILSAILAYLIIPRDWTFFLGELTINSWQIYLTACGLPILFGVACLTFFPETPKFLMSQAHNEKALKVFKTMYAINSGKPQETYPIKVLEIEAAAQTSLELKEVGLKSRSLKACVHDGMLQMKPLFMGSYFLRLLLVITIQFCTMLSTNTIRLWQPQLFAMLQEPSERTDLKEDFTFCEIIDQSTSHNNESIIDSSNNSIIIGTCIKKMVDNSVYTNTIIVSASSVFFTLSAGLLVGVIKSKYLLLTCYFISAITLLIVNWSKNMILTLVCISLFVGILSASVNLVTSVVVNLFPTTMRTMAVSLTMMSGRTGVLIGNLLFPLLLKYGCTVSILSVVAFVIGAFILAMFIPQDQKSVK